MTHGAHHRRPNRGFQCVQVSSTGGRRICYGDVLISRAARAIIPSGHIDATGRRADTSVSSRGTFVHVQFTNGTFESVGTRALARQRTHAAIQTFLFAYGCTRREGKKIIKLQNCIIIISLNAYVGSTTTKSSPKVNYGNTN